MTDLIRVTRTETMHSEWPIDLTETEFRKRIACTLIALGDTGALGRIDPAIAEAMYKVGEYLAGDEPIGDPDMDYSILGTFQTVEPEFID